MMKVGSLFSGIGGLDLGLENTKGFKTIWFIENDKYASKVLKKNWPNIPNYGDITKINWENLEKPDVLVGGFPCQDISIAGKGKGIEGGKSGLWREFAKAISVLKPRYVIVENVPMLTKRGLWVVLRDLAKEGYDAEWHNISARSVGAWHKRERIFIIAYSNNKREFRFEGKEEGWGGMQTEFSNNNNQGLSKIIAKCNYKNSERVWKNESGICRVVNGIPNWIHRIRCLGNAVVPQVAEVVGYYLLDINGDSAEDQK